MKRYEYKLLEDSPSKFYGIDDYNEFGKEGWKVVYTNIGKGNYQSTLLEREITD